MTARLTRAIDPITKSYTWEDGAWRMDDTGYSQIHMAIYTRLGTVPGDTNLGNRLFTRKKLSQRIAAEAEQDMLDAVQILIDDGTIEEFEVVYTEIDSDNPNQLNYGWRWVVGGDEHYWDDNLTFGTGN